MNRGPYELPAFDFEAYAASLQASAAAAQQGSPPPAHTQPPAPRSPLINVWIAWVVIGLSVLTIFGSYFLHARRQQPDVTSPNSTPDPRFEITARYTVGVMHLAASATAGSALIFDAARGTYLEQVEKAATTTVDRVRLVPIIAELKGKDAAIARLDVLTPTLADPALQHDATLLRKVYEQGAASLTATEQQGLTLHHGWFGRLALAWNAAPTDAAAQRVYSEAERTMAASFGLILLALLGLAAGLVLFVVAMIRYANGQAHLIYVRAERPTVAFLEAFAVYVGGTVLLSLALGRIRGKAASRLSWAVLALALIPALLAVFWPLLRGVSAAAWRRGLGLHTGRGLLREMALGLVGYLAGLPIVVAGALITLVLSRVSGGNMSHPLINEVRGGFARAWPVYVLASIYAPLIEETLFRGALFHHLRGRHGWWLSALLVSVIFAAMHPQGWAAIPVLASISIVFCGIRQWRGTIFASVAAHALHNGLVTTMLILSLS